MSFSKKPQRDWKKRYLGEVRNGEATSAEKNQLKFSKKKSCLMEIVMDMFNGHS
jgi:hypothetical protein